MEIIRRGVDPVHQPLVGTCKRCQSVVKFHPLEATFTADQRDGNFYQIKCPVCPATITVNEPAGYNGPG